MVKKKTKEKDNEILKVCNEITAKLFELVGMKVKIDINEDEQNEAVRVNIDAGDQAGLIIGNRGRTLTSFQTIIGMLMKKRSGEWKRIFLNVSDWREKEEDRLKKLAEQVAERVKETNQPQHLYNLTSSQRRMIHLALSNDPLIKTESQGDGKERYLVVSSK